MCNICCKSVIKGIQSKYNNLNENKISDSVHVCRKCMTDPNTLFLHDDIKNYRNKELIRELKNLIIDINKNFPVSSSRQFYFNLFDNNLHKGKERSHSRQTHDLLRNFENTYYENESNKIKEIEKNYAHCLKISIANCHEMAHFCLLYFYYKGKNRKINYKYTVFSALDADHVFFCIHEDDIKNSGIICDPWYKSVFLFKNLPEYYGITKAEALLSDSDIKSLNSYYTNLSQIRPRRFI
ncbi:hypothetical protein [Fluviispira multicolorata]|uniref:Uncharacterized protein n=1 Tax=Fluviispira multicolorata TaxID=2654512 RepID=A0A833JFA5_9BACT|nr:hypothetical protein [Fluviispira multicolorata]KAB8033615.1 hypothetical protein GCL57_02595 [Fluviispira multicolorata]